MISSVLVIELGPTMTHHRQVVFRADLRLNSKRVCSSVEQHVENYCARPHIDGFVVGMFTHDFRCHEQQRSTMVVRLGRVNFDLDAEPKIGDLDFREVVWVTDENVLWL